MKMNTLKQLFYATAVTICFSLPATAQRDPEKKTPPKDKPPIIVANPDKKPTPDKPKDDRRKPNFEMFYFRKEK